MAYTWAGMKKITHEQAIERCEAGLEVFRLYDDETEAAGEDLADLNDHHEHGGEFGYSCSMEVTNEQNIAISD